jgi:hypothetical protein
MHEALAAPQRWLRRSREAFGQTISIRPASRQLRKRSSGRLPADGIGVTPGWSVFKTLTTMLPLVAVISLASCGSSSSSTSTADLSVASKAYLSAWNTLMGAEQALIDQQNAEPVGSPELPTSIHGRLVLRRAFDKAVTAINVSVPKVSADIHDVLAANQAVETALEDLLANTNVLSDYASASTVFEAAIGHFSSANTVVLADFGLSAVTSG